MIATLILYTCLVNGADCKPTVVAYMPMLQCDLLWQLPAAKYISDNPERRLIGYACLPGMEGT